MKRHLLIGLGVVAVVVVAYLFLAPQSAQKDEPGLAPVTAAPHAEDEPGPDPRVAAMRAAFEALESDRRDLSRQIGSLQVRLWGLKLPAEQARAITEDMMVAQHLVKDPPMLGAFRDPAGIRQERDRVQAATRRLREIEQGLPESGFEDGFSDPVPGPEDR